MQASVENLQSKSVFIVHNGRDYSDRKIYFVKPTIDELPYFTQLLAEYAKAWPVDIQDYGRAHVLGIVTQAEWRTSFCSVTDFIVDLEYLMHERCADVAAAKTCWSLARILLPAEWIEQPEFELIQLKRSAPQ